MAEILINDIEPIRDYTAAGGEPLLTFPFPIFNEASLKVLQITSAGVVSTLALSTHYAITGVGVADGGYITFNIGAYPTGAPAGYRYVLYRDMPIARLTDFLTGGDFKASVVNSELDSLIMMLQQNERDIRKSIGLQLADPEDQIDLEIQTAAERAGRVMIFGEDGDTVKAGTLSANLDIFTDEDVVAINAVAENLAGVDTIGQVAAIAAETDIVATNIDEVIAVANGMGQLNNGDITLNYVSASGVSFADNEIGLFRSSGFIKATAEQRDTADGLLGIAIGARGGATLGAWLIKGLREEITGLLPKKTYYLSTTAGGYSATPPYVPGNAVRPIGQTDNEGVLNFDPSNTPPLIVQETNTYPPVTIEGSSSTYSQLASFVGAYPDGLQADEHVLFVASYDSNGTSNTFTPPADSEEIAAFTKSDGSNEGVGMQAWLYRADGTEGATYNFAQSLTRPVVVVAVRISGLDSADPVDVSSIAFAAASEPSLTSNDTTVDQTVTLAIACWDAGKTLVTPPNGFTAIEHVDLNGSGAGHPAQHDLWVGYKPQATAGATGALTFDLSASEDWVGFNISLRKFGATAGTPSEFVAPFNVANDGFGNAIKLTIPENSEGNLTGRAFEIKASTSPDYVAGQPQLENYTHPRYFTRTANAFRMSSPRVGATTSENASSARTEFRDEKNYLPTEIMWWRQTVAYITGPDDSDCVCVQAHRSDASPVVKTQWKINSNGSAIALRFNVKKRGGATDERVDKDGKSKIVTTAITFDLDILLEFYWNPNTGDLKIWVDRPNTDAPDLWFEDVEPVDQNGNLVTSYIKPGGPYPGTSVDIDPDTLFTFDIKSFIRVEETASVAPTNISVPVITGTQTQGQTLTASNGVWAGSSPISYTRQWNRAGVAISGATNSTYVLQLADVGQAITCTVTANNGVGSPASATSAAVTPVGLVAPVFTVAPVVSGLAQENGVLTSTTGTYTGSEPITPTYQWYRAPSTSIGGATNATYLVTSGDIGFQLFCRVTLTNSTGSDIEDSNSTAVVIAEPPQTLLSTVVSSVVYEIDATVSDSYPGSGSMIYNLEPTPADGELQAAYDMDLYGLTFNGSAGDDAAYFSSAGAGYIDIATRGMTNFLKTLHKTSGTSMFFLAAGQFSNAATNQTFFSTLGSVEDNAANNGMLVRTNTSEQPRIYQLTAGTPTKKSASPVQTLLLATPSFFAMSFNILTGAITTWVPNGAGGITEVVTNITLQANTADPDGIYRLMACTAATQLMVSGTRVYAVAKGNTTITVTDLQNMLAIWGARHARDYTP